MKPRNHPCGLVLAVLTLAGCREATESATFSLGVNECLQELSATPAPCLAASFTAIASAPTPNGCLVLERIAADGDEQAPIARLPVEYRDGRARVIGEPDFIVPDGARADIALFLFATPADEHCDPADGIGPTTPCDSIPTCRFKLSRFDAPLTAGAVVSFRDGPDDACVYGTGAAAPETCDGEDEDCDGRVDEADTESGLVEESCQGPIDIGECARPGHRICLDGAFGECLGLHTPQGGLCIADPSERVDHDCDGEVDEALNDCGGCDDAGEQCNGIDDDCDGRVDERLPDCMCQPRDELCNGRDEDCDGSTDEGFDLTTPERCGACDNDCHAEVTHADSSVFSCVDDGCVLDGCLAGYVDLDGDPTNGCECGPIAAEIPDDGVDQDCDRLDYVGEALHVAADAAPDGDGTPARPLRSLADAIDAVRDRDLPAVTILLARGTYRLAATLDVPDGVSIVGGFTRAGGEWQPPAAPMPAATTITGPGIVLRYADLDRDVALRDLRVQVDAAAPAEGNSAAVAAERVASHLRIIHAELIGGPAAAGEAGAAGQNAPRGGARGGDGSSASDPACPGCGGLGASPIDCGPIGSSGGGGDGGTATAPPAGRDGEPGRVPAGAALDPAPGGTAGPPRTAGGAGTGALAGANGEPSPPGRAGGAGRVSAPYWIPAASEPGAAGEPGAGGGGGGAGGPGQQGQPGGGGGGGGSGGCPGLGGGAAGGGFGAFGLIIAGGTVILVDTLVRGGLAGSGGDGGSGGFGQLGGARGEALPSDIPCGNCTPGGNGGPGGDGGCGGNAGGGAGGPAFAVLRVDPAASHIELRPALAAEPFADQRDAAIDAFAPGARGRGGFGGQHPATDCAPAEAGPPGVTGRVGCCPADAPCDDTFACPD
ncbi:MAG: MopE-related protein [bacterium]